MMMTIPQNHVIAPFSINDNLLVDTATLGIFYPASVWCVITKSIVTGMSSLKLEISYCKYLFFMHWEYQPFGEFGSRFTGNLVMEVKVLWLQLLREETNTELEKYIKCLSVHWELFG